MTKVNVSYENGGVTTPFMFSDGPETVGSNLELPQALLCYGTEIKYEKPIEKRMEIGLYHNNDSGDVLRFGVLIHNKSNTPVTIRKNYLVTVADSTDENSQKDKVSKCAELERDFANGDYNSQKVVLQGNSYGFALAEDIADDKLICARMRLRLTEGNDLSQVYVRVVACKPTDSAESVWINSKEHEANEDPTKRGQFAGVVKYLDRFLTVTVNNYGDYFELFNTGKYYKITYGDFVPETLGELDKPLYAKLKSKPLFDGNYGIEYNVGIWYPGKKGGYLKITPPIPFNEKGEPTNLYAKITMRDDNLKPNLGWYTTTLLTANKITGKFDGAWYYQLPRTDETKDGRDMKVILPGGNCGNIRFEYVKDTNS